MGGEGIPTAEPGGRESAVDVAALQATLAAEGVKYCLAAYVDVHGVTKGKAVPLSHLGRMSRGSELYTGAALDGLGQGPSDEELAVIPDLEKLTILPWRRDTAWVPGDLTFRRSPWPMCARTVLKQQMARAERLGLRFNLGIECEIYLVRRENGTIVPANPNDTLAKAAYDVANLLENMDWLDEIVGYMDEMGWDVHSFDHEDANSQFELDFAYADAVTMADRYTLWRLMAKEVARRHGFEASFMPKPYNNRTGSGAHLNMSMEDISTGRNLFGEASDPRNCGLSPLAYKFLAGILKHAPAIVAVTCPTVNSYKRLVKTGSMTGYTWAPIFISYGGNNRTHMLRVPMIRPEIEDRQPGPGSVYLSSARVECRAADVAFNPYLAAAMMLGAGLDGIENDLDPGDPHQENMYELSDAELAARGVAQLPRTLLEAIEAFGGDSLGREVMGDDLFESYIALKSEEWWRYHNEISPWEIDSYLTKFG